ncbi:MAG: RelB antitoxin [Candidatus Parcubacteria bacterium]|jgi:DNA-damage-inducible protein J
MATVQVRMDEKVKKQGMKILNELGLDMSTAINAYFRQIISVKGIPFPLLTENGMTLAEEREILKASEEAKRGINMTGPMSGDEAVAYLRTLRNAH